MMPGMSESESMLRLVARRRAALKGAIIGACSAGPVPWQVVQRAVNLAAEGLFGDITRHGTTTPAYPLAMELVASGALRRHLAEEPGVETFEVMPLPGSAPAG